MKKSVTSIAAVLLFALIAAAQDVPRAETFIGYTYVRANSATDVPAFSMNGGGGQFALNFNHWIGVVADLGAVHNGNISGYHIDSTLTNFMFGPRISIRKSSRVKPFLQALWGGVYGASSTSVLVPVPVAPSNPIVLPPEVAPNGTGETISLRAKKDQTAFAQAYGGGIDIRISKHVSFRPIELDYYMTRLQNYRSGNDNNQHNLRYMTGLNFSFGAQ
jgi:hypothetical protein